MSRILKVMIVLLAITAMVAPSVFAEDRLGLSGQMRVRGWYLDDGGDSTNTYADQRLRIGGKLSVAEGVSITFRTDFSEQDWGSDASLGRQTTWQLDRAHLDLANDQFAFRAGQQNFLMGHSTIDFQDTGAMFTIKGAVPVTLIFSVYDDTDGAGGPSDQYIYGVKVGHKTDSYASDVFVVGANNGAEQDVYAIGATLAMDLGAVKLDAELDVFTGDHSDTIDAMGTQLYVDAAMAASEMATVGGRFYYAMGADSNEAQYTMLGNGFNGWDPANYGPLENEDLFYVGANFDFTGDAAGVIGGQVYADIKASDATGFTASLAYLTPEEDNNTVVDSALLINLGMTYDLMANTSLAAQVQYGDVDAPNTDETTAAGVALYVNF